MKIAVDTNILVRTILQDDIHQAKLANDLLLQASLIFISLPCLCELVWVLRSWANFSDEKIALILQKLLKIPNVEVNRVAAQNGIKMLQKGGDFADAIMEYEGNILGADVFYSFDKKAIKLLQDQAKSVQLLR
ncbi:MAG: type II toxin-antitoxin system VapC family toxin [Cardiobacteriaceae bacterium]|nr:type II toxin-antitoxin system VapC family toxin [Cardiobacteriaceae bacterium]